MRESFSSFGKKEEHSADTIPATLKKVHDALLEKAGKPPAENPSAFDSEAIRGVLGTIDGIQPLDNEEMA